LETIKIYPIREESEGMAGHEELENKSSQEDYTKEGPFKIDEILGPVTYQLKLLESWRIHNVFHATLLRPYIKNEVYGNNYPRPLPELLEGEEVYEVKTILKHRRRGRGYQYYVKWRGYPITEATWENKSAFSSDGDMIQQYKDQYQL
jgi:Chromo (CHRromatin Organisation MOdifier) domain